MTVAVRGAEAPRLAVFGAGLVGCYLGGCLAGAGAAVTFVGRAPAMAELRAHGLRLTDADGLDRHLTPDRFAATDDAAALAGAELILLTVKSDATAEAAATIARHAPGVPVLSFQNGVGNMEPLAEAVGYAQAIQGMIPYNIAKVGPGHFHRGVSGTLAAANDPRLARWLPLFAAGGVPLALSDDMAGIAWAKLLINLNNAVNALSGLPLLQEIGDRRFRRVLAITQREALGLLRQAGIRPARLGKVPPRFAPFFLSLPDPLFRRLGRGSFPRIDARARSSMADDLVAGRRTEVDHINGAVVALAERLHRDAPANRCIVRLIRAAEAGAEPWAPDRLLAAVRAAR